jgi:NADPH-dependent ferric siderophore reductase
MLPAGSPERPAKEQGRLRRVLTRLLMKRATVTANEALTQDLRLVTLEGPALEGVAWQPGQKLQIAMGSAFVTRTYTPIAWNPSAGRVCFLGYAHGDGPGSRWLRSAASGEICDVFGPRTSLDMAHLSGPLLVMGDETSIGLAYAATHQDPARNVTTCLEVGDVHTVRQAMADLGLSHATLVVRRQDDEHIADMEAALAAAAAEGASFVLTGKAGTIQRLRQNLRKHAIPASRCITKAYWAPGKTGLD